MTPPDAVPAGFLLCRDHPVSGRRVFLERWSDHYRLGETRHRRWAQWFDGPGEVKDFLANLGVDDAREFVRREYRRLGVFTAAKPVAFEVPIPEPVST